MMNDRPAPLLDWHPDVDDPVSGMRIALLYPIKDFERYLGTKGEDCVNHVLRAARAVHPYTGSGIMEFEIGRKEPCRRDALARIG